MVLIYLFFPPPLSPPPKNLYHVASIRNLNTVPKVARTWPGNFDAESVFYKAINTPGGHQRNKKKITRELKLKLGWHVGRDKLWRKINKSRHAVCEKWVKARKKKKKISSWRSDQPTVGIFRTVRLQLAPSRGLVFNKSVLEFWMDWWTAKNKNSWKFALFWAFWTLKNVFPPIFNKQKIK